MDQVAPKKTAKTRNGSRWWTQELETKRSAIRRAHKRGQQEEERNLLREYKREIATAKQESWGNHCTKMENIGSISSVIKALKADCKPNNNLLTDEAGITLSRDESHKNLLNTHFPRNSEYKWARQVLDLDAPPVERWNRDQVQTFGKDKAAGPDGWKRRYCKTSQTLRLISSPRSITKVSTILCKCALFCANVHHFTQNVRISCKCMPFCANVLHFVQMCVILC